MKIALLTNEYPPNIYGGAGVHVEYLSRELARLDAGRHEIEVRCFGDQREDRKNLHVRGIGMPVDLPSQDLGHPKLLDPLLRNILMAGALGEAEIVHCHTWYTHLAGCLLREIMGVPLVLTTHSLEPQRPWKSEQLGAAYRASSWIEKTAYENADGVIAVSKSMEAAVHEIYGVPFARVRVIPNGIDVEQYRPTVNPAVLRKYGVDPDRPFILFVGRITRQKGVTHLVEAIPHLDPGIQVVLCAGAPDTPEIAAEMTEKVRRAKAAGPNEIVWIEGWVPRNEAICLFTHAAVFVCPSVYEPFGIINLEAMACGTPVVASAIGGIPEVVIPGETGLLVPLKSAPGSFEPEDPGRFARDLANAVNDLLRSEEARERMGRRSRERVEEEFSWKSVARQTLEFYGELIKKNEGE